MPTAKPRLQVTLRQPTYLLLGRLAKLRRCSKAQIVSEFVEEIAPVLQRLVRLMEQAQSAQDWPKRWRADIEVMQGQLESQAKLNLDLFERIGSGAAPGTGAPRTPEPVTRGSESRKTLISRKHVKNGPS